jgi:hypothetical protein
MSAEADIAGSMAVFCSRLLQQTDSESFSGDDADTCDAVDDAPS